MKLAPLFLNSQGLYCFQVFIKSVVIIIVSCIVIIISGTVYVNSLEIDKDLIIPVAGANQRSWDNQSYWHAPWGKSKVHKGIDIFAAQKTPVFTPINGWIISAGYSENGGNYQYILGAKFRIYYFAHLNTQEKHSFSLVKRGERIGFVGNSGNAIGSPYHLHFSVFSIFPVVKKFSLNEPLGWMKMFYLDPVKLLIIS